MTDYSDLKLAVEIISGGKNTVLVDNFGLPSVVVPFPKMSYQDVDVGDAAPLPAFVVDGEVRNYFCVGKYMDSLIKNVPCSLPMQLPSTYVDFDTALKQSRSKGEGWCLTTNAMYAAIALWCRKNGFMPHGNSGKINDDMGMSGDAPWEKGLPLRITGGTALTLTGSGPVSWNHNNDITGICDLNGNAAEWAPGVRLMNGEINIIPDNDAALGTANLSEQSPLWKAIDAKGNLVPPGSEGTIKIHHPSSSGMVITTNPVEKNEPGISDFFNTITPDETISEVPQLLYGLALVPKELNGNYGNDRMRIVINNETLMYRGSSYGEGTYSGVFNYRLDAPRSIASYSLGRRSAFIGDLKLA